MQQKFLGNVILVLLLNFLIKPFYILGIDAEFLNRIEEANPGEYGLYFSLVGLTFIFNIFLDLGINNFNSTEVGKTKKLINERFSSLLTLKLVLTVVFYTLLLLAGFLLNYHTEALWLLVLLGFNQVLVSFILFFRSNLAGLHLFVKDSILSVVDRLLLVVIGGVILWGGWFSIAYSSWLLVGLQTFAYLITLFLAMYWLKTSGAPFKVKLKLMPVLALLKKSLPYALLILLMMIYYRVDALMIERMLPTGAEQSALYAQGFRFFEALTMIGYLFAGILLPMFSNLIGNNNELNKLVKTGLNLIMVIALASAVPLYFSAEAFINWRYNNDLHEVVTSASSFKWLLLSFVFMCITYIYGTLLTAHGSLKTLNYIAGFGVVVNLVGNIIVLPNYGIEGAAMVSFITQTITAILQLLLSYKILKLNFDVVNGLKHIGFVVLSFLTGYVLAHLNLHFLIIAVLTGISILVYSLLLRLLDVSSLKMLVKSKLS